MVQGPFGPNFKNLQFSHKTPQYGCLWNYLDPSSHFRVIWTLGPNFCSNGPLAPNSKNCNFLTKPHNTGVYGLAWTPAFIFEVIFDSGTKFLNQGPFGPNLKKMQFSHKTPQNGCLWNYLDPRNHCKVIWTLRPNFCSKGLWPQIQKIAIFS